MRTEAIDQIRRDRTRLDASPRTQQQVRIRRGTVSLRKAGVPLLSRCFLIALSVLLPGYALVGKSFAYLGFPPVYIGEMVLALGMAAVVTNRRLLKTLIAAPFSSPVMGILLLYMLWEAARTVPFLPEYGVDALRDGVLWGYGLFAWIIYALICTYPLILIWLLKQYKKFALVFPPFAAVILCAIYIGVKMPQGPGDQPLVQPKWGDTGVHLAGAACLLLTGMESEESWLRVVWIVIAFLFVAVGNRGGALSFAIAVAGASILGKRRRAIRYTAIALAALMLLITVGPLLPSRQARKLSVAQLQENFASILGRVQHATGNVNSTERWREEWWKSILQYTFEGPYFWTGKGYGINLADSDGFQVVAPGRGQDPLRSPHNGHVNILARSGVPGFALWLSLLLAVCETLWSSWRRALDHHNHHWSTATLFLLVVWIPFIIDASFDVFLEGPMGGIWFWIWTGIAAAAVVLYRQRISSGTRSSVRGGHMPHDFKRASLPS